MPYTWWVVVATAAVCAVTLWVIQAMGPHLAVFCGLCALVVVLAARALKALLIFRERP